jgi:hypothetical protein
MLERLFHLSAHGTSVRTEVLAGVTTFLTMAYILFVNPDILAAAGMDRGAVFVATALASIIGCLIMGLVANYPVALAPGMGLNAYFAYVVVGSMGFSWQTALGAVFLSGLLFLALSVLKLRAYFIDSIPRALKSAISAGIGLFLAIIGLMNAGLVVAHPVTLVTLGDVTSAPVLLAAGGFVGMIALQSLRVPGAMLIAILGTALAGFGLGVSHLDLALSLPPSLAPTFLALDIAGALSVGFVTVATPVDPAAAELLRAHVAERSTGLRVPGVDAGMGPGQPEVGELHGPVPGQEHVVRRQVAMHRGQGHALRVPQRVQVAEPAQQLGEHVDRHRDRDRTGIGQTPQGHAVDQLHHQGQGAVGLAGEVEHLDHIGMVQRGHDARFADEHLRMTRMRGQPRLHALDGHAPLEVLRAHEVGAEHLGHAAGADALAEPVSGPWHWFLLSPGCHTDSVAGDDHTTTGGTGAPRRPAPDRAGRAGWGPSALNCKDDTGATGPSGGNRLRGAPCIGATRVSKPC